MKFRPRSPFPELAIVGSSVPIPRPPLRVNRPAPAFTLVEITVSIAILTLLVLGFTQVVNLMSNAWSDGQRRVDNYTRARGMLDLISQDLQAGVFRADLGAFVNDSGDNRDADGDPIYVFYTRRSGLSAGSGPLRNLSLVSYTLDSSKATLQRGDLAVAWSDPATLLSFGNAAALPNYGGITVRVASPGVVAFKLVFMRANGDLDALYTPNPATNPVKAVGVTLAVIDQSTIEKLGQQKVEDLISDPVWDLPPAAGGSLIQGGAGVKAAWTTNTTSDAGFNSAHPLLGNSLVIFERFIPLLCTPTL